MTKIELYLMVVGYLLSVCGPGRSFSTSCHIEVVCGYPYSITKPIYWLESSEIKHQLLFADQCSILAVGCINSGLQGLGQAEQMTANNACFYYQARCPPMHSLISFL